MSGIAHWMQGPLHIITLKQVPVLSHLGPALAAMTDRPLAAAIKAASPLLRWVTYPYEGQDIGEMFPRNHAFATLMGEYGPYQAEILISASSSSRRTSFTGIITTLHRNFTRR